MKRLLILAVMLVLILAVTGSVGAAPRATTYGPTPVYDSGWVLTTSGLQTFDYESGSEEHAVATSWKILVADDEYGHSPTESNPRYVHNGIKYGHLVRSVACDSIMVSWESGGIGYSEWQKKWYQRGSDYARLIVLTADDSTPSCRP